MTRAALVRRVVRVQHLMVEQLALGGEALCAVFARVRMRIDGVVVGQVTAQVLAGGKVELALAALVKLKEMV